MALTPEEINKIRQDAGVAPLQSTNAPQSLSDRLGINPQKSNNNLEDKPLGEKVWNGIEKSKEIVNKIFPGKEIGESIGTLSGLAYEKTKGILGGQDNSKFYDTKAPSPLQTAADAAAGALTLASGSNVGMGGNLASKVANQALIGAGMGYTDAVAKGKSQKESIGESFTPGVVGAAIPVAGKTMGAIADTALINTPRQLVNFALKTPVKKVPKDIASYFLENKLGGKSLTGIRDFADSRVGEIENEIQSRFSNKVIGNVDDFIEEISRSTKKQSGAEIGIDKIKDRLARFVPDHAYLLDNIRWTDAEANTLRKAIDNNLKEAAFQGKELTNEQKVAKTFADKLRSIVQSKTGTEDLFKEQSKAITLRDVADDAINKSETQGRPGLLDVTAAGIGGGIAGIPGAAAGVIAQRALRSPRVQGAVAQALHLSKPIEDILAKLEPLERNAVLNFFSRSSDEK